MPLVTCPDCAREVSDAAPSCPQCGRQFATTKTVTNNVSPGVAALVVLASLGATVWYASTSSIASSPHTSVGAAPAAPYTPPQPTCAPSDFALSKITYSSSYGYLKVRGVLQNSCVTAAGVQLQWTAYNKDGTVAFTDKFWPGSTVNMQPGVATPFETSNKGSPQIVRHDLIAIDTHVW